MARSSRNQPGETLNAPVQETPRNINDFQSTFAKNQKAIIGAIVAVVVLVGGYFGYKQFVAAPNEDKAAAALFPAERWFEVDSFNLVLNGNGQRKGALEVIKKFGGTAAGNLAHYYAGVSYLQTGDAKNAIAQLEKFDGKGTPLEFIAYGVLGDAYMDNNAADKGIEYYKKAAGNDKDNYTTPRYLYRAGLALEKANKTDDAKKIYLEIRDKFPYSNEGNMVIKNLARLGEINVD
jgi:tetratricopeptide (TPR) repeat protein